MPESGEARGTRATSDDVPRQAAWQVAGVSMDVVITLAWTAISFAFVCLAVYGMSISTREDRDTADEVLAQSNRKRPNGILILGLQQATGSKVLKWCHRGAFVHQFIGFLIGVNSLYLLLGGNIDHVDTPTVDLGPVQEYFVPIFFMLMLIVICLVQAGLIRISHSQRKARIQLRALEMDDEDSLHAEVIDEIARKIEEFRNGHHWDSPHKPEESTGGGDDSA